MPHQHSTHEARRRLREIIRRGEKFGLTKNELSRLSSIYKLRRLGANSFLSSCLKNGPSWFLFLTAAVFVTVVAIFFLCYSNEASAGAFDDLRQQQYHALCTVDMPQQLTKAFRPPEDCSMCRGLRRIDRVSSLSPITFQEIYSDYGRPVVVTDATKNWTAHTVFNFQFLKDLYEEQLLEDNPQGCRLTSSTSQPTAKLSDIFNETSLFKRNVRPWNLKWKNCGERASEILRQHFSRPYFLPSSSRASQLSWIYLGSPGYREAINIEIVDQPSWQAQMRGSVRWFLHPPPECYYQCESLEVTLHPGEMIVVDTTRWYHESAVVSDEPSIAVGDYYEVT